jgi:hypothetical protein
VKQIAFLAACAIVLPAIAQQPPASNRQQGDQTRRTPQVAGARPAAPAVVAADGSSGEPVVVTANVDKCIECKGTAKKRIAVLPVRVGSVAADAGSSPDALAQTVADRLETVLKGRPEMLVLGRSNLQAVLGEQDLATKGITNAELAPQRGRVIPAELLLQVTLDRVDVAVQTRRTATSDAARRLREAHALENQALQRRETAAQREIDAQQAANYAVQFKQQQAQMQQQLQGGGLTRGAINLGALGTAISAWGEQTSTREAETALSDARQARLEADRMLMEARQAKETAQRAATSELQEARETTATINVIWRAIDTMTNEVVASNTFRLSDKAVDERRVSAAGGNTNETSHVNRAQGIVNKLIEGSMDQVAGGVGQALEKVPFRGQIVRVNRDAVMVNVGRNYGVEPGDTFSVRRIDTSLIDPATGRSLAGPGTLEGLIRIVEVNEQVSRAVVLRSAGKLSRGDNLEWVGVFK